MSYQSLLKTFAEQNFFTKASYLMVKSSSTTLVQYPNDQPPSIFDIASLTKIFSTGCMLADAMENHGLNLNSTVADFPQVINELELSHPKVKQITLQQLISHTSGLMPWVPFYALKSQGLWNFIFDQLKDDQQRRYSDVGFILLGKILENHLKLKIDTWFKQKLILPLNLQNTGYRHQLSHLHSQLFIPTSMGNPFEEKLSKRFFTDYGEALKKDDIKFRQYRLQGECNDGNAFYMSQVAPHAGLFSTAKELSLIVNHWMNGDSTYLNAFKKIIASNKKNIEHLFCASDETLSWNKNLSLIGHHGFTGCSFSMNLDFKTYRIFLSNRQYHGLDAQGNYPAWKKILSVLSEID